MKKATSFLLLGVTAACSEVAPTSIQLCEQTVLDYATLRDNGPVEAYANLFTTDGTFQLGDMVTTGREALIARHKSANSAASWRHTMGDIRITETDNSLTGHSRFVVKTGARETPSSVSREIIGHYEDTFAIEGPACKIASRKVHILFDTSS